jgi:hypothetical protein
MDSEQKLITYKKGTDHEPAGNKPHLLKATKYNFVKEPQVKKY